MRGTEESVWRWQRRRRGEIWGRRAPHRDENERKRNLGRNLKPKQNNWGRGEIQNLPGKAKMFNFFIRLVFRRKTQTDFRQNLKKY